MNVGHSIVVTSLFSAGISHLACADPNMPPIDYSLQALRDACEPFIATARHSAADSDAAFYCLVEGEAIALSASRTLSEAERAKKTIERWIKEVRRESLRHQRSLAAYP